MVYTDGTADGNAAAQAVLASCEADFAAVQAWFGGISLPVGQNGDDQTTIRTAQPLYVVMDPNAGGAYHYGCNATDLYIEPAPASAASGLVVAEEVEVFEAAINNGWDCGHTNGEALSRVLAVARNSALASITTPTAQSWWADGAQDYVNDNSADDQNQDGNGCGTLFLSYLNSQLGYSWTQIATTGGATLGACYQSLTGQDPTQGFSAFVNLLSSLDTGGQLSLPSSGNPFPIGQASAPSGQSGQQGSGQGVPVGAGSGYSAFTTSVPRAHVLTRPSRTGTVVRAEQHSYSQSRRFSTTQTVAGKTTHFTVYTDGSSDGNAAAQAVLASCEADFAAVQGWFGGLSLPAGQDGNDQNTPRTAQPCYVLMDPNAGGAYHYACNATDLYIEPNPANQASGLMVAELVEVFEAAINNGWNCGQTNGEALSRVLATARNSGLASLIGQTAQQWWSDGHNDYVTNNNATDQDQDSNGCGPMFLYYLNSQLGYSWQRIVTAGGSSLGATYQTLTGKSPSQGFSDFVNLLSSQASGGQLNLPSSGNPFPIGQASQPASGGSSQGGAAPVPTGSGSAGPAPASSSGNGVVIGVVIAIVVVIVILAVIAVVNGGL